MGQYWLPVNLDKKEFIHPHKLGSGLKLMEQAGTHPGTAIPLLLLVAACPVPRGGGDPTIALEDEAIIGRWAGDRIALVGDYTEKDDLPAEFEADKIYDRCCGDEAEVEPGHQSPSGWTDITDEVCACMERQLGIKYKGDGWRDVVDAEEPA